MAVRNVIDFALCLHSFRGIDIATNLSLGIQIKIAYENPDKRTGYAVPFDITYAFKNQEANKPSIMGKPEEKEPGVRSTISDDTCEYLSKSLMIKFQEEEIELSEIVLFRAEYDLTPGFETQTFKIIAELIQFDFIPQPKSPPKKVIQTQVLSIQEAHSSFHRYVPIIFNNNYYSVLNMTVHCVMSDVRYRAITKLPSEITSSDITEVLEKKGKASIGGTAVNTENATQTNLMLKALLKSFPQGAISGLRGKLLEVLKGNYEKTLKFYEEMFLKCVTEQHKKIYKEILSNPPGNLIVPDFLKDEDLKYMYGAGAGHPENNKVELETEQLLAYLTLEVNFINTQIMVLWVRMIELLRIAPRIITQYLEFCYIDDLTEYLEYHIGSQLFETVDVCKSFPNKPINYATRKKHRMLIEDVEFCKKKNEFPEIYEQIIIRESPENVTDHSELLEEDAERFNYKGVHLLVLAHGFQGNSLDMRLLRNNILLIHPEALVLCSLANEDNTEGDIEEMGKRLAKEVEGFITDYCPGAALGKMSFIGHSLGGLIIRAALPHLEKFSSKMYMFMTFSSPHLGFVYNSSMIIDTGIWLLKKIKKSLALLQLTMTDKNSFEECFLYKLAKMPGLNWFKNVVLFSSQQDQYSPYDSARMEISRECLADNSSRAVTYKQMAGSIRSHLQQSYLHRVEIAFKIHEKNIDTFIGRAAHIKFLECDELLRMIVLNYNKYFS